MIVREGVSRQRVVGVVGFMTLVGVSAQMAFATLASGRLMRLADWNPAFEIIVGDEVGGGRAYEGNVSSAILCAGRGSDSSCFRAGVSREEREHLVTLAHRSQLVRADGVVVSSSDRQTGPARIISFSESTDARNLTLAQSGRDLVLRVRFRRSGPNASRFVFVLLDAVCTGVATRVSVEFDRGITHAEASSGERVVRARMGLSPLSAWILHRATEEVTVGLISRAQILGALVLFLPVGIIAAWGGYRQAFVAVAVCGIPYIVVLFGGAALTEPRDWFFGVSAAAVGRLITRRATGFTGEEGGLPALG
jgi:hypothetical protein